MASIMATAMSCSANAARSRLGVTTSSSSYSSYLWISCMACLTRNHEYRGRSTLSSGPTSSSGTTLATPVSAPHRQLLQALQVERTEPREGDEPGRCHHNQVFVALNRQQICEEFSVALRDLRTVDPGFKNQIPLVLVRPKAVLVCMSEIRLIISRNRMLVFDYKRESVKRYIDNLSSFLSYVRNDDDDDEIEDGDENEDEEEEEDDFGSVVSGGFPDEDDAQMNAYLSGEGEFDYLRTEKERVRRRKRRNLKVPFEIRALEASLDHVCYAIERKYNKLHVKVSRALKRAMLNNILLNDEKGSRSEDVHGSDTALTIRDLESLLPVKHKLRTLYMDCKETSEAIQELLDNDEDLDGLYLLDGYASGGGRLPGEHEEAEMMLENYLKRIEQVRNDIAGTRDEIGASDEHIRMALDRHRNSLLKMSLMLNIIAVSVSSGAVIPALFGMNLLTTIEDNTSAFGIATGMSFGVMLGVTFTMLAVARRYRITLM